MSNTFHFDQCILYIMCIISNKELLKSTKTQQEVEVE